jgi:crotonobetainyl-CoA:carnitine CoA-transferase CaiB-like acyl-CoA transferase
MMSGNSESPQIFEGLRVVEYTESISGAYCARLLGDAGADVIKVETLLGDSTRLRGPFPGDSSDPNLSGLFLYLNYNKRGITAKIDSIKGREVILKLLENADILVLSGSAPQLDRLQLYYSDLEKLNPSLIVTAITPYGLTGPYREYMGDDLTAINHGGLAYVTPGLPDVIAGSENEPPLRANTFISDIEAGIQGASATLLAIINRLFTGDGDQVDLSVHSAVAAMMTFETSQAVYNVPNNREPRTFGIQPNVYMPCKDGYVVIAAWMPASWNRLKKVMGDPDWADSEVFIDQYERARNWDALYPLLLEWTMTQSGEEILTKARIAGLPAFPVYTVKQIVQSEHLKDRGFWVYSEGSDHKVQLPGYPAVMSETPWRFRRSAPNIGEHTSAILQSELGYSQKDIHAMVIDGVV